MGQYSLTYAVMIMVISISVFALLFGLMPTELFVYQEEYEISGVQSKEVVEYFSAHNLEVYSSTWEVNITAYGMEYSDNGLPNDHRVEIHWNTFPYAGLSLQFRHAYPSPLGAWWLWFNVMHLTPPYQTIVGSAPFALTKEMLLALSADGISAQFEVTDGEITQNFIFEPFNSTWNLGDSWNAGIMHVMSSYEVDFDSMKPNAWMLFAQLLTFQSPDFGLPGMFGTIVTYGIALGFWLITAIIIYTVITRIIPTIQGGIED